MRQRSLGMAAIVPDAGYVAERDLSGLRLVLSRSAAVPGAVALLALANSWMRGEGLRLLLAELRDIDVPVALVLEHREDPLGVLRILQGVVALLRAGVTLLMLRCDVSAIGRTKSAYQWRRRWRARGTVALASRGAGGAVCRLGPAQLARLLAAVDQGPAAWSWAEDQRWTLERSPR